MAAARMVLLALSVVVFAAAWSGDKPRGQRVPLPATTRVRSRTHQAHAVTFSPQKPVDGAAWVPSAELPDRWQAALPTAIAAGDYTLVEATGHTQRITLTAELLQTLGHDPDVRPESIYTLSVSDRAVYLIRVVPVDRIASR